jgi:hypothetical protein
MAEGIAARRATTRYLAIIKTSQRCESEFRILDANNSIKNDTRVDTKVDTTAVSTRQRMTAGLPKTHWQKRLTSE